MYVRGAKHFYAFAPLLPVLCAQLTPRLNGDQPEPSRDMVGTMVSRSAFFFQLAYEQMYIRLAKHFYSFAPMLPVLRAHLAPD
ncbi:hypothetical protein CBR_g52014 [Chara braunii]|uniref:Secreted protein n=1 Tax=Chara braunii TaxID=69332 RepID=A0A388K6Z3_CHABU|nr:hypothetical protein CBR_g52014 [Chara braunii]|eukprot:GBG65713.1 hypothetical protein CBR_g52014 [Chara braunii]